MLVLNRKCRERIMIAVPPSDKEQLIAVTLVDLVMNKARIGLEAPDTVSIHREEVYLKIVKEGERRVKKCDSTGADDQNGSQALQPEQAALPPNPSATHSKAGSH